MAMLVVGKVANGSAEGDEDIVGMLRILPEPPVGLITRLAGPTDGGWRILTLWKSREDWDRFYRERVAPIVAERHMAEPQFEYWPIESIIP